jgi:dTDP-glucose 4,6-dehydratase
VNLDKLTYAGNQTNLTDWASDARYFFVQGDIADEARVKDVLCTHAIDTVINFAAESHVDRSIDSAEPFIQTNVVGTLRLLNAVRNYWAKLSEAVRQDFRFLHISTDEVYGSLATGAPPFTERSPFAPSSPYAASKAASDHLVQTFFKSYGLPACVIHCSNNYGPYQFPEKLIPLMILNALEGRPLPVYGDGSQRRDWLHVEDHVTAISIVLARGHTGESYNVGGGGEHTNLEVVRKICQLLDGMAPRQGGRSHTELVTFVADRPGHDRRYANDYGKLHRESGWKPVISFEAGLARTVQWYLTHRTWCAEITAKVYARERLGLADSNS